VSKKPESNIEVRRRVDEAGNFVEETEMVDGQPHGIRRIWSKARIQIGMAEFNRGKLHGRCLVWFDDGRLYIESSYFEGRLDGDYRSFWPNGKPREIGRYADGARVGKYQWFDETGALVTEQEFPKP
jgi:antitoxin component YwqK of YwqJK toxin-antitoxin module